MLRKGLQLYNSGIDNIGQQILINTGTESAEHITSVEYSGNAFIPKKSWRPLTPKEHSIIMTNDHFNPLSKSVSVGRIPQKVINLIKKLQLSECTSLFDIEPKFQENEELVMKINKELDEFLKNKSSVQQYKFHRIAKAQPNRETTTFHFINKEYIRYTGLHIDESRKFTPHTAYKSDNRISINISSESRYLYYINLSLRQIYKLYHRRKITTENIVENFLNDFPDYPVIRLEIKPYQYYIAPTDNFIHDGSTLGNKEFDITIVYTGKFDNY
ncbi:hypothetical protein [Chryseobacterium sp. YR221]|uniref:hypothetical protein n=1 Tax=Chryseobacterium sp. YR221 TaxID=1500293 RepID=UPI0009D88424|nr:hypothetical protein [Chryseobacterium sp. YR221]SMC83740.1 hypothetical protein SAMN02787074_3361 [Chryseobacterium sp. YR221]